MDEVAALKDLQESSAAVAGASTGVESRRRTLPEAMKATQWVKGQSGNLKGPGKGLAQLRRDFKRAATPEDRLSIVRSVIEVARDTSHRDWLGAVKLYWDRRYGPIVREMTLTSGIPSVSFEVHLNAPGQRVLPALPVANEQRVIDVTPNEPIT